MSAKEIIQVIQESNFTDFGIRGDDRELKVGDECGFSRQEFDDIEPYELDGTCAINLCNLWLDGEQDDIDTVNKVLKMTKRYNYTHHYIVAGDSSTFGNDENEVIISANGYAGAVVIAVID